MNTLIQSSNEDFPLKITKLAVEQLLAARASDEDLAPAHGVRVSCTPGGCAGFSHSLDFEDSILGDDLLTTLAHEGEELTVIVDPDSANYMQGVTLNYLISDWGEGFKFEGGDKLQKTCACGSSSSYCE